ncbi:PerC family transcriptional regulator [Escherichia coli]|uniref:PerC family transcriptional regulator n=1 Tax=Escherichia coli TaxID=562 RepID=UPI0033140368
MESANLWRRASARWLMLMGYSEYTEARREWMRQRRAFCLARIPPPAEAEHRFSVVEGCCSLYSIIRSISCSCLTFYIVYAF